MWLQSTLCACTVALGATLASADAPTKLDALAGPQVKAASPVTRAVYYSAAARRSARTSADARTVPSSAAARATHYGSPFGSVYRELPDTYPNPNSLRHAPPSVSRRQPLGW